MTNCKILHLLSGAKEARGLTVIIDVFRAFSLECYLYDLGAKLVRPVGSIEEAKALHEKIPGSVLIGERQGIKVEGFDFGNSPSQVEAEKDRIEGRVIIHTTSAGTQGIVNAVGATEILTGSLVNAKAVAEYHAVLFRKQTNGIHKTPNSSEEMPSGSVLLHDPEI